MLLHDVMRASIGACNMPRKIGVAFSGGIDSTILACICNSMRYDTVLLTVGFEGSHDVLYSRKVARTLDMPHHTHVIQRGEFADTERMIRDKLTHKKPLSWYENGIAFYFVSRLAKRHGLGAVATANGIDELYCGYDVYRRIYEQGKDAIISAIRDKLNNELDMLQAISGVCDNITLYQPFLGQDFIDYSFTVPLHGKVRGTDDYTRKHAVRHAAEQMGIPYDVCYKRKKALQYGTKIHRNMT